MSTHTILMNTHTILMSTHTILLSTHTILMSTHNMSTHNICFCKEVRKYLPDTSFLSRIMPFDAKITKIILNYFCNFCFI